MRDGWNPFPVTVNIDDCVRETNITKQNNPEGTPISYYMSNLCQTFIRSPLFNRSNTYPWIFISPSIYGDALRKAMSSLTLCSRLFANTVIESFKSVKAVTYSNISPNSSVSSFSSPSPRLLRVLRIASFVKCVIPQYTQVRIARTSYLWILSTNYAPTDHYEISNRGERSEDNYVTEGGLRTSSSISNNNEFWSISTWPGLRRVPPI